MSKLVKYLPREGILSKVLTARNPSVPLTDETLLADVPPAVQVVRARTLEPGYGVKRAAWREQAGARPDHAGSGALSALARFGRRALIPDPQVLWLPAAHAALGMELVRWRPDAVLISGPPFSQFVLGACVQLKRGTALILDYRDEWSTCAAAYEMAAGGGGRFAGRLERRLIRLADVVTTATEAFRGGLLQRFETLAAGRVVTIPNGYDPDDFPNRSAAPPPDRFRVTYAGTIFSLTSARGLLGAIRLLHAREPELSRRLDVTFIGRVVETEEAAFSGLEALGVRRIGYLEHRRVLEELAASHLTLCLLDRVPGAERIYPAKVFELMYLGRPCLTLAPQGALTDLVRTHRLGPIADPRDEEGICGILAQALRTHAEGGYDLENHCVDIGRYHRGALAGDFAAAIRRAVAQARRTHRAS